MLHLIPRLWLYSVLQGKVSLVCNAMREAMLSSDSALYLKPIVTSFAIQDKLEDALQLIKDTKEMQLANEGARNDLSSISGNSKMMRYRHVLHVRILCLYFQANVNMTWQQPEPSSHNLLYRFFILINAGDLSLLSEEVFWCTMYETLVSLLL